MPAVRGGEAKERASRKPFFIDRRGSLAHEGLTNSCDLTHSAYARSALQ